ncbi:hypothetical protein [Streptomyces sp. NPDC001530]|uniref:hypothetical protein n=1 Tax=Streptomyces sp. NPDC001530 TaxID=3364582 RepID=UPI0036B2BF88
MFNLDLLKIPSFAAAAVVAPAGMFGFISTACLGALVTLLLVRKKTARVAVGVTGESAAETVAVWYTGIRRGSRGPHPGSLARPAVRRRSWWRGVDSAPAHSSVGCQDLMSTGREP